MAIGNSRRLKEIGWGMFFSTVIDVVDGGRNGQTMVEICGAVTRDTDFAGQLIYFMFNDGSLHCSKILTSFIDPTTIRLVTEPIDFHIYKGMKVGIGMKNDQPFKFKKKERSKFRLWIARWTRKFIKWLLYEA